ncbi:flagellar motor protein [uncultured Paludibaculum sp.]|uniref:flagellar motor protein n=1 Tax=uncultured Paludibaculum sp. TaxID=1765020 RepID=UPI002AABAEB2|nr:flagellar motor protein [uncultured Paludibaculum sp.]
MATADESAARPGGKRLDYSSLMGALFAVLSIVGGLILEGGHFADIRQASALLIVLGGTLGAVLLNTPLDLFVRMLRRLPELFYYLPDQTDQRLDDIAQLALKARREGIVSLEDDLEKVEDPFLHRALALAVDGMAQQEYRETLGLEIELAERRADAEAQVLESAGGYAPTLGILGAVLGLIQVMKHIENIDEVGPGIAVAFVATLYGVGSANLLFLPAAGKLKARSRSQILCNEMVMEGVAAVMDGLNPKMIRQKLASFQQQGAGEARRRKGRLSESAGVASVPTVQG